MSEEQRQFDWSLWREKQNPKHYLHFDMPVSLENQDVWDFVTCPDRVSKYAFYPFIYFQVKAKKYVFDDSKGKKDNKCKNRPICYSAHLDRCIFKYYGMKLNLHYEEYLSKCKLGEHVLAYRRGMAPSFNNNIWFAKKAFDCIRTQRNCHIMVGDFEKFFDRIDHEYLKSRLLRVLGQQSKLCADWFAVFKAITQYKVLSASDIAHYKDFNSFYDFQKDLRARNQRRLFNSKEFRSVKKLFIRDISELRDDTYAEHRHKRTMGIPQGSAMSGVLSNVYMTDFDRKMLCFAQCLNGHYMRYSDDFIVVIPTTEGLTMSDINNAVSEIVLNIPNLKLSADKVSRYTYSHVNEERRVVQVDESGNPVEKSARRLDYLGFSFDGQIVELRDRTIFRYFNKFRKATNYQKYRVSTKQNPDYASMYRRFSSKKNRTPEGQYLQSNRNFISYSSKGYLAKLVFRNCRFRK